MQSKHKCDKTYRRINEDGNYVVCTNCGLVVDNCYTLTSPRYYNSNTSGLPEHQKPIRYCRWNYFNQAQKDLKITVWRSDFDKIPYKRQNHFNQIMLAWTRESVKIPSDVQNCVVDTVLQLQGVYQTNPQLLSRKEIKLALQLTTLPENIQIKYKSKRAPHSKLTNLLSRKQFLLRWWSIRDAVCDRLKLPKTPLPDDGLVESLKYMFSYMSYAFVDCRHVYTCPGGRCSGGCRYGFPNTYHTVRYLLKFLGDYYFNKWQTDFPVLNDDKYQYKPILDKIFAWLGWSKYKNGLELLDRAKQDNYAIRVFVSNFKTSNRLM